MKLTDTASLEYDLEYFSFLREKWKTKKVLKSLYNHWFQKITFFIPDHHAVFEIGGGAGNFKDYFPRAISSDILPLPWLDMCYNATECIPINPKIDKTIVLIDVLHHISNSRALFEQINHVTKPGDRVIFMEPYVSLLSYPFYGWFHHESVSLHDKPLRRETVIPNYANSATSQLVFGSADYYNMFPQLKIIHQKEFSSLEYALSGGFNYPSLYPASCADLLSKISSFLCRKLGRIFAFRQLVVLEKTATLES